MAKIIPMTRKQVSTFKKQFFGSRTVTKSGRRFFKAAVRRMNSNVLYRKTQPQLEKTKAGRAFLNKHGRF